MNLDVVSPQRLLRGPPADDAIKPESRPVAWTCQHLTTWPDPAAEMSTAGPDGAVGELICQHAIRGDAAKNEDWLLETGSTHNRRVALTHQLCKRFQFDADGSALDPGPVDTRCRACCYLSHCSRSGADTDESSQEAASGPTHNASSLRRLSKKRKNGQPMTEVMTPIGISPGAMRMRARMSAPTNRMAPPRMEAGNNFL